MWSCDEKFVYLSLFSFLAPDLLLCIDRDALGGDAVVLRGLLSAQVRWSVPGLMLKTQLEPGCLEGVVLQGLFSVDSCRCRSVLKWLNFLFVNIIYFSLSFLFLRLLPFSFQFFMLFKTLYFTAFQFQFCFIFNFFWRGVVSAGCYHVTIIKDDVVPLC